MTTEPPNTAAPCPLCRGTGFRRTLGGPRRCRCTPAPVKPRSLKAATHEGECGFCERRFTVGRTDNHLALHGFQRPGTGWLLGDCPGHDRLPVELSTETIVLLDEFAKRRRAIVTETIAYYQSGECTELTINVRRQGVPFDAPKDRRFEDVTVHRGAIADYNRGIPSFDDLLQQRLKDAEATQRRMIALVERCKKRIVAWAPTELRVLQ